MSQLTFEMFLQVFNSWRVSSMPDKLELLFKVLDVNGDGELSPTDIAYFSSENELKVGERVIILKDNRSGTLRWKGVLKGKAEEYCGVELDTETGKHNGSYQGKAYFKCDEGKGIFISPKAVASENMLSAISQAVTDFSEENTDKITVESFKAAASKLTGFMGVLSRDILPKELSEIA